MARTKVRGGAKPSDDAEKQKPKKEILKIERSMEQIFRLGCSPTLKGLESVITSFIGELEPYLSMSNKTQKAAEEEKQKMKEMLIYFNSIYREIPETSSNRDYLSKMSDVLAHYIGLEVFTSADPFNGDSREGKELMSRIVSTLYSMLDSSEDHVLDTMMKLKAPFEEDTPKKDVYSELFKFVVRKAQKLQVNDYTYIRYVLVYRLWKKMIKKNAKLKEMVIKKASKMLWPPPDFVKRRWAVAKKVLPKPRKNTLNVTEFFMREKYNVRKAIKKFLDETSEATHLRSMFVNLSCNPRLLNPKIREFGPLPPLDAPIQEFSTFSRTANDVWQRLHEDPHSWTSVFEEVTKLKKPPICTPNRMFNLLHSHHLRHKARKAERKKMASRKARLYEGSSPKSVVGGIITNHRIPGSFSGGYGLSIPNTSNPVNRDTPNAKTRKRRILNSQDIHLHKKSKSDLREDNHLPMHPPYVGAGSLRKDNAQLAKVSPFSENPPKLHEVIADCIEKPEKFILLKPNFGCSSNANSVSDVKSVKVEPDGWQSGSSSPQRFGDPGRPGKLAIEEEVEQALHMLQKSQPPTRRKSTSLNIETSPIKAESGPAVAKLDNSNGCGTSSDAVPDWGSMWGAMGVGHPHDLNNGNDIWLDELLSYPTTAGPEGQDFWSLIGDEISDNS